MSTKRTFLFALIVASFLAGLPAAQSGRQKHLDRLLSSGCGTPPLSEQAKLGRLLFFDPILSGDRSLSCAHCHRPEHAFSDGLSTARGNEGRRLSRNTPSLYNVGCRERLFWDGRAPDLETQALGPLLSPREMNSRPEEMIARLNEITEYRALFARAFDSAGAEVISLESIAAALAAFERTLLSKDSRYDRYVAGDRTALIPSERRGLRVFRSLTTRCFECHPPPLFAAPIAARIGVPGADEGLGGGSGVAAQRGLFRVPSLRNVARTAPYMHDGSIATLDEVVRFYARGGGHGIEAPPDGISDSIRPFEIDEASAGDLVAFLGALTDESARPEAPQAVPSGLPVVTAGPTDRMRRVESIVATLEQIRPGL